MSPESQPSTALSVLDAPGEDVLLLDILGFLSHQSQRKSHLFLDPSRKSTFSFAVTAQMEHRCPVPCRCFQEEKWPGSRVSHKNRVSS